MTKTEKTEIIKKYARHEGDTGSPEVQIAVLTKRINDLTEHLQAQQEGPSLPPGPAEDGWPETEPAQLSDQDRYRAVPLHHC